MVMDINRIKPAMGHNPRQSTVNTLSVHPALKLLTMTLVLYPFIKEDVHVCQIVDVQDI